MNNETRGSDDQLLGNSAWNSVRVASSFLTLSAVPLALGVLASKELFTAWSTLWAIASTAILLDFGLPTATQYLVAKAEVHFPNSRHSEHYCLLATKICLGYALVTTSLAVLIGSKLEYLFPNFPISWLPEAALAFPALVLGTSSVRLLIPFLRPPSAPRKWISGSQNCPAAHIHLAGVITTVISIQVCLDSRLSLAFHSLLAFSAWFGPSLNIARRG